MRTVCRWPGLLLFAVVLACCGQSIAAETPNGLEGGHAIGDAARLFQPTKVWIVHFRFAAEQWAAMEPTAAADWSRMLGGGRRDARVMALESLASAMLKRGDRGGDGKVDRDEFLSLAETWFSRWDRARFGGLDSDKLQAGLNLVLDPENLTQEGTFPISLRGPQGKRNGLAAAFGLEFKQVHAAMEIQGISFDDIGIRYKGNGTFMDARGSIKRSLKAEFNQFVKGRKLAGLAKLNFHNNVADPSAMNEALSYQLYRAAGVPAPRTGYARVYVTVPAKYDRKYFGLYALVENVDVHFARDRFGNDKGALFKPVTPSLFADLGDEWPDYQQVYDPKTELDSGQQRRVIEFAALVTHADDGEFAARIADYLDLDQFARYMAVTVYLSTMDGILLTGQNYYLYLHPRTGRFQFIPWDLDHSFGQIFGEPWQLANLSIDKPWAGPNRFLERVFKVEAFQKAYRARLEEFSRTIFKPDRFHRQVDEIAAAIRPAIEVESQEKATQFNRLALGGPIKGRGGLFAPKPVRSIKGFVDARTPSVLEQLAGKSLGEPARGIGATGWGGRRADPPGKLLGPAFLKAMDANKDRLVARQEFVQAFERWFRMWNADQTALLTHGQLRAGIEKELLPVGDDAASSVRRGSASQPTTRHGMVP